MKAAGAAGAADDRVAGPGRLEELRRGARDVLPVVVGVVPWGLIFGSIGADHHFGVLNTLLMSFTINAATAQVVGLQMIVAGGAPLVVVLGTVIINSRLLLYSLTIAPFLRRLPPPWRLLLTFGMTDLIFVMAHRRFESEDGARAKHWYFMGSAYVLFASWIVSTYVGYVYGLQLARIPELGLDFAIDALLIAFAMGSLANGRLAAVGVAAGVVGLTLQTLPGDAGLYIAVPVGAVVGLTLERWSLTSILARLRAVRG